MIIVGAGMAGLLAGNMLRHRDPHLYELQPNLPNNHSAVLRFRTSSVGDVLNIPFKKVTMIKAHAPWKNLVADALAYSFKNTGEFRSDRSIIAGAMTAERWVAPPDLIQRMAAPLAINYGARYKWQDKATTISTVPMPALMQELGYPNAPKFNWVSGVNIKANIESCDAYISLLVPDPAIPFSRISITGSEVTIEVPTQKNKVYAELCISVVAELLGIKPELFTNITMHEQRYAKITPIDDELRKSFMHWATVNHNIYSLGRFACWRPHLLMDDLIHDVRKIDSWMSNSNKYDVARDRK